ncbi:MAG: hypothetical protein ACXVYV_07770 [Gaiellales bacterium]
MDAERSPMQEAEAQLYRRIQELRARARGAGRGEPEPPPDEPQAAAMPDLRTILARAESHVEELRATAAGLERSLPERVEQAISRAMEDHSTTRRFGELRDILVALSRQVDQVNRDLLAERLGRVEDLELVVDLISTGMAALRQDVANLSGDVNKVSGGVDDVMEKLDQPLQVTVQRPERPPERAHGGMRELFAATEPSVPQGSDDP